MNKFLERATGYLVIMLVVYGMLTDMLWARVVCLGLGVLGAIVWLGWDWFVVVLRHGRTHHE